MRRLLPLVAVVALVSAGALAAKAIQFDLVGTSYTFTDCASGGSTAQTIATGTYWVTVNDDKVFLCEAASGSTCAANGKPLAVGTGWIETVPSGGRSVSCRSGGTGDLHFQRVFVIP